MPPSREADTWPFVERLSVPWHWWPVGAGVVAVGGAELVAGLRWQLVVAIYLIITAGAAAALTAMGRARVQVDAAGIHAGGRTLPLRDVVSAQALDAAQTRAQLGPAADPSAHVVTRGWIRTAVLVRTAPDVAAPYWLLSSRRPGELVTAVRHEAVIDG